MGEPVATINTRSLDVIEDAMDNLENLCTMKISASDAFSEACKAVSERAWKERNLKIDAAVIRAFVTAKVRDKLEKYHEQAGQMSLLAEELE